MKKNKILLAVALFLIVLFISSLFVTINNVNLREYWFSISCVLIGLYSLLYCAMYKLDSSLYYGTLIIWLGILSFMQLYLSYTLAYYYPTYMLSFAFASLAVFALFRQKIHFKLFAFFVFECILLIVYKINILNIYWLIAINGIYLLLIALNMFFRIKHNLKVN